MVDLVAPLQTLTEPEFRDFQRMIFAVAGIHMPDSKRTMVAGRLAKRLKALQLQSYGQYWHYVERQREEKQIAVDLLTTNETYFFREPGHFEFLQQQVLPAYRAGNTLRLWSAACSSGEEAYTAAMVIAEVLGTAPWQIVASDISTQVLTQGSRACYPMSRSEKIPELLLKRYCLRGTGEAEGSFKVVAKLRERVQFAQINLNKTLPDIGLFDVIMLRNVMIYFNQETKRQIVNRLRSRLKPGGYFIIGHSETLNGFQSDLHAIKPSVYRAPISGTDYDK
ncbi:chemotaxis protein methyltransferase [Alishewanella longhuensis]|uniref:Chemotaxis protein methyltransferase n=2 Tax=Alishewanella longhuensis TaxID=1091037 RepID=A0ABQ3KX21_9ALTE|nr:chemotaxis protein methyltransferase [Alishewanella longhuensis]